MMTMLLVLLAVLAVVAAGELVRSQCRRMIGSPATVRPPTPVTQLAD